METVLEQCMLLVISLVANGLSALAGGGAGLLQLPALLFLGLAFGTALATHKIASVALGVGATFRHIREKGINPAFAGFILLTGLPGVVLGALVILAVPDAIARLVLGLFTAGLGIYSWRSPQLGLTSSVKHRDLAGWLVGGFGLFFIGFLNGSITSGTGLFVTLWLVVWFGFDYQRAVTYTLILVGLFWNGFGAITLVMQTDVKWEWIPALIVGALLGGYFGAHLSIAKGSKLVKRCFECVTVVVGGSLIVDGLV
ncbi:sulfite exporter TauE/SafE family protein [Alkalimarinus alittae]|uniref:Probable membrane transporter protein n=1 Tax=Alkalimarinus alittae TaxID=2961619 RepID=A0ABY6N1E8_9ALTE|nr:sulfite exporter TauE/SafE family protein [Alkalimarinus alittae]UZE95931.1 sulfite exporter TauE/SafE family protein [Alkalimarinus alittae]